MSKPLIEAHIQEINRGAYYNVRLHAVPKVGELIELFSFIDQAADYPPGKHYEVIQVLHDIHDVSEEIPLSKDGSHFVKVFV